MAKLTSEERSRINRLNGSKGGPKTAQGKAKSRGNALKHGLRAQKIALPNEDPQKAAKLGFQFARQYQPQTVHQHELVDRVTFAAIQQRRCQNDFAARARETIENAQANIDRAHHDQVDAQKAHFKKNPARAVAGLRQTALRCGWLLDRWIKLRGRIINQGGMFEADQSEMVKLTSEADGDGSIDALGFYIQLHAILWGPRPGPYDLGFLKSKVPDSLWEPLLKRWANPEDNKAALLRIIDEAVDELTAREAYLRNGPEAVERKYAADQAVLNLQEKSSGLWLRYYKEINSEYFRATKELRRSLAEDEESDASEISPIEPNSEPEKISPNEPNDVAEISPNEPNASEAEASNELLEGTSATRAGQVGERETGPTGRWELALDEPGLESGNQPGGGGSDAGAGLGLDSSAGIGRSLKVGS
jgi:hypothetical protein